MNTLSTKTSLYDLLSMIIPGYLLLFLLQKIFLQSCSWPYDEVTFGVFTFAASYIVGMALHWLSKCLFCKLRNCECLISKAKEKVNNNLRNQNKSTIESEDYYTAYYIASSYAWSSVPILEAQYSFLRSAVIVELLYLILGCSAFSCPCFFSFVALLLVLTIGLMLYVLFETHIRIWEDYYYITQSNPSTNDETLH